MTEKSLVAQPAALNWRPASRAGRLQAFRMGRLVFVPSIVIRQRNFARAAALAAD